MFIHTSKRIELESPCWSRFEAHQICFKTWVTGTFSLNLFRSNVRTKTSCFFTMTQCCSKEAQISLFRAHEVFMLSLWENGQNQRSKVRLCFISVVYQYPS